MKANKPIVYILTSAAAFVLLITVASAAALTNHHASARTAAPTVKARPAQTDLTPAATVASPASSPGEDIRDIRQPRHVPAPLLWILAAAGVVTLAGGLIFWRSLRNAPIMELTPQERALERLEAARPFINPEQAREYGFAVSQIIRSFVEEQLQLRAPRLTTEEFLRELVEDPDKIAGAQRALLGDFLEHCDLAKFAGWRYSLGALTDMHDTAIEFVLESSVPPATAPVAGNPSPTTPENNLDKPDSIITHPTRNAI